MSDNAHKDAAKVRIAMVGAGAMANYVHYPSLASFDDVEIAAICDIDPERLNNTGDKYHVEKRYGRSVTDYRRMIEETAPDAVYVIGQPHIMYDIWVWCLEHGLNLYIEKPMGITIHQARSLAYLADKFGCITQVSFQRRRNPLAVFLRGECVKRGPITHAQCRFYKSNIGPYTDARDHMMDDCVHSIDTLRWLCGGEVAKIESMTKRMGVPDINFISASLHFENGSSGYLLNSWTSGRRIFSIEMHANNICAEADLEGKGHLYSDGDIQGMTYDAKEIAGGERTFVYGGFRSKNREFIDCVKSGTQPESNFGDAVKTMEVAERILAQAILDGR